MSTTTQDRFERQATRPQENKSTEIPDIATEKMLEILCNPLAEQRTFGAVAEVLALHTLRADGMEYLDHNYACRYGEIDLVMRDGDDIVFVEVKARRSTRFGTPAEAVTARKQYRIRKTALDWLRHKAGLSHAENIRFDVVAILVENSKVSYTLYRNAF